MIMNKAYKIINKISKYQKRIKKKAINVNFILIANQEINVNLLMVLQNLRLIKNKIKMKIKIIKEIKKLEEEEEAKEEAKEEVLEEEEDQCP